MLSLSEHKRIDDDWLRYRWDIFASITVPSVNNQTDKDFTWVILFDKKSPSWLKDKVNDLNLKCRLYASFQDFGSEEFYSEFRTIVGGEKYDVTLLTRLDSDDAIHRAVIERIKTNFFSLKNIQILNFEIGYQYEIKPRRLAMVKIYSPPFSTKVNLSEDNPFWDGGKHTELPRLYRYQDISYGDPMFLQSIHRDNLANRLCEKRAYLPHTISTTVLEKAFNIKEDTIIRYKMSYFLKKNLLRL